MSLQSQYPSYPYAPNPWIASVACEGKATNDPCAPRGGYGGVGGLRSPGIAAVGVGLAAGLVLLEAFSSSQLSADQNSITNIITATSALTFTTAGGVTGEEVAAFRSQFLNLCGVVRQGLYDAALLDFGGRPASPLATVQIAAITQPAAAASTNNGVVVLALALLALFAFAFWA